MLKLLGGVEGQIAGHIVQRQISIQLVRDAIEYHVTNAKDISAGIVDFMMQNHIHQSMLTWGQLGIGAQFDRIAQAVGKSIAKQV